MNKKFISTPREGEKLFLKNSTYKNILKEDEISKKEATYINETNCPNYDVTTTKITKLKKHQKKRKMIEILTNDVKLMLNYDNAKKVDIDKLKVSQQTSKNFEVSGKKHLPVKKSTSDKFAIYKNLKTNALTSNTNQNKRIKIANKDEKIIKKYSFKPGFPKVGDIAFLGAFLEFRKTSTK